MADESPPLTLKPISIVRSEVKQAARRDFGGLVSEIVLDSSLAKAL